MKETILSITQYIYQQQPPDLTGVIYNALFVLAGIVITVLGNIATNYLKARFDNKGIQITAEQEFRDDLMTAITRLDGQLKERDITIAELNKRISEIEIKNSEVINDMRKKVFALEEENHQLKIENKQLTQRVRELETKWERNNHE